MSRKTRGIKRKCSYGCTEKYNLKMTDDISHLKDVLKALKKKNLIKNPSGEDDLDHWTITANGGDKFKVEFKPSHVEGKKSPTTCFTTSFYECTKHQLIDLAKEGIPARLMDSLRPDVKVSEWYVARSDCNAIYTIEVSLLDAEKNVVAMKKDSFKCGKDSGHEWQKAKFVLDNYPTGVRYIKFEHGGKDTQFWKGHYGCKMSKASVTLD